MDGHKATIVFTPLRTNLVNLPSRLGNLLANANIKVQDVIIEVVSGSEKHYVGWSGWNSGGINSLEIDLILALALKIEELKSVVLNLKVNNYETRQASLEPLTSSDWELVELHAQILEDKLLSQTRCVTLNQTLVVYPSQTTSARLLVTDIGTKSHNYAKLSPQCEVSIAPKPRVKKSSGPKSSKSVKSLKPSDGYTNSPSVLKRAIPLPHTLYGELPGYSNHEGYEVYCNFLEVSPSFKAEYVAVSAIPGPNFKSNVAPESSGANDTSDPNSNGKENKDSKDKEAPLAENKRIVAKLVNYRQSPSGTVGLSRKLAVALSIESQLGNIVTLKPAVPATSKHPSSFVIHPYTIQTKKSNQVNINSAEKKDANNLLIKNLESLFYEDSNPINTSCITNFCKIPIIPIVLPHGGLLRFTRNELDLSWIQPFELENHRKIKIDVGEELLRSSSFIEELPEKEQLDEAIGLDNIIQDTMDSIIYDKNCGVLVYGNSGSGKTLCLKLLAKQLSQTHGYHVKFISCDTLMNENFNLLSTNHLTKWFQECAWYKPSVLLLDNLDKIIPAEQENADSSQTKNLSEFIVGQIQKLHSQQNSNFSVITSATAKESLHGFLFLSHLIEEFHALSPPDKSTRAKLLNHYFTNNLGCEIGFDIMDMVAETEGYLPNDLKTLTDRVYHETLFNHSTNVDDNKVVSTKADFETSLKGFTPSNLRGVKLEKSAVNWSDIGGLQEAKNVLLETLEWPTKYAPIFANCPLRLRSGILLYGYPGCGKTLLASAVAGQCGLNFISIKGPEILNKYIGASEQSVRELFERAQAAKPCILFFDEFDSIAPKRGHDSTGVTDRVVNQMLTQMDGAEGLDGVYVLAATSRPDLIDSALLRPGRLDKSVICNMPDYNDRLSILQSICGKMNLNTDVNLEMVAKESEGLSGADMQGLGYNAYLKAVHTKLNHDETLKTQDTSDDKQSLDFFKVSSDKLKNVKLRPADKVKVLDQIEKLVNNNKVDDTKPSNSNPSSSDDITLAVQISQEDFLQSLEETKPSISVKEKQKLLGIYHEFVSGRDGNMPDGSASNDIGGRSTLM